MTEFSRPVAIIDLRNTSNIQKLKANSDECETLAKRFNLIALKALEAKLNILPWRKKGWRIEGHFTAVLIQRCSVTLEPAHLTLSESFERGFLPESQLQRAEEPEVEMIFDEEIQDVPEALSEIIDLGEIVAEALSLSLPLYPRSQGLAPLSLEAIPPGAISLNDERAKPFAKLATLKLQATSNEKEE